MCFHMMIITKKKKCLLLVLFTNKCHPIQSNPRSAQKCRETLLLFDFTQVISGNSRISLMGFRALYKYIIVLIWCLPLKYDTNVLTMRGCVMSYIINKSHYGCCSLTSSCQPHVLMVLQHQAEDQ